MLGGVHFCYAPISSEYFESYHFYDLTDEERSERFSQRHHVYVFETKNVESVSPKVFPNLYLD